jgi:isovaleryl-CoA dehydrogenase
MPGNNKLKFLEHSSSDFASKHIAPIAADIEQCGNIPANLWLKMGNHGLLGITAPTKHGGLNLGYRAHCIAMQALSAASPSLGLSYAAHSNLCINQICLHGTEQQQKKYLPALIEGTKIGALAISEVTAGSDAMGMQLKAKQKKSSYILSGRKSWVTNGPDADVIIVYAKSATKNLTAFIVSSDMPGVIKTNKIDKIGMKGSATCEIIFDNVEVPSTNILGEAHKGTKVLMEGLNYERLVLAAGPIGIMQAAIEHTLQYIRERKQFGTNIAKFQLIQEKIAQMYTSYNASLAYLNAVAEKCDEGIIDRKNAASVILFASEKATQVASDAIQCFGGNGYTQNFPVSRLLQDAKLYEIGAGTTEIRKILIATELLNDS